MRPDAPEVGSLTVAVALDAVGRAALERLAARREVAPDRLACFTYTSDDDDHEEGPWQRLDADKTWHALAWSVTSGALGHGLEEVVRRVLSLDRMHEGMDFAGSDLVIIVSREAIAGDDGGDRRLVETLRQVRERFARITCIFLVIHGEFPADSPPIQAICNGCPLPIGTGTMDRSTSSITSCSPVTLPLRGLRL